MVTSYHLFDLHQAKYKKFGNTDILSCTIKARLLWTLVSHIIISKQVIHCTRCRKKNIPSLIIIARLNMLVKKID